MTPPSFFDLDNIEQYLKDIADLLVAECSIKDEDSAQGAVLARLVPGISPEHWAVIAARHNLQDWHVLPLPTPSGNLPKKRKDSIMVRADEKKFLFSGSV